MAGRPWKQRRTHCKRGHEFTTDNTLLRIRDGVEERECKTCHNERMRKQQGRRLLTCPDCKKETSHICAS